jgi:hypothetical protein
METTRNPSRGDILQASLPHPRLLVTGELHDHGPVNAGFPGVGDPSVTKIMEAKKGEYIVALKGFSLISRHNWSCRNIRRY